MGDSKPLPAADQELARLRFDPLSAEDFAGALNRAIFDVQQEFLYSDDALASDESMAELDPSLVEHMRRLRELAQALAYLREDQRHKDLVDSILRLRRGRLQQTCRELELLIRHTGPGDESTAELGQQLVRVTREQKTVERALFGRSHSSHWMTEQQRLLS